jgi:hypothetical protein
VKGAVYTDRMALRRVKAIRYIQPLREGGSLPVLVEGDDGRKYVVKLRGAGQGPLALVAEVIGGEIARALGLRVPEIVAIELDAAFGRNEPDAEIQDLLKRSAGLNIGLEFIPEATLFDAAAGDRVEAREASFTVWLDAYILNVDRTAKNANLLLKAGDLWLIDHGASLYFHHLWSAAHEKIPSRFEAIRDHVLLRWASEIDEPSSHARATLRESELRRILSLVPDDLLGESESAGEVCRAAYLEILRGRLAGSNVFEEEINNARSAAL